MSLENQIVVIKGKKPLKRAQQLIKRAQQSVKRAHLCELSGHEK